MRVRLTTEPDGRICLESAYDEVFVADLKRTIHYSGREWHPARKRWLISALYADDLITLLESWGATIHDAREQDSSRASADPFAHLPPALSQAYTALYLLPTAPLFVAESVYRAVAKQTHPDTGGDPADFRIAQEAITTLRHHLKP